MSDPDWELSVYCRIRWYKVLPYYGPNPSTWAIGMIGTPSAWRAQDPKAH